MLQIGRLRRNVVGGPMENCRFAASCMVLSTNGCQLGGTLMQLWFTNDKLQIYVKSRKPTLKHIMSPAIHIALLYLSISDHRTTNIASSH